MEKTRKGNSSNGESSRLRQELTDLHVQLYLGTILKTMARALIDSAAIAGVLFGASIALRRSLPLPQCADCFQRFPSTACCCSSVWVWVQLFFYLTLLFVLSTISTKLVKWRKLQHSNFVTVFTILGLVLSFHYIGLPGKLIGGLAVAVFFVMFFGYRASFLIRRM